MRGAVLLVLAALAAAGPAPALAWGATGHRIIGRLAIQTLPADLPAFLRTPEAAVQVGELAREPDRSRAAGDPHDADLDPGHFINLDDAGRAEGGPRLADLPRDREAYERALAAVGSDSYDAGYLPYNIVGGWQQLVADFAHWRVAAWGERKASTPEARAWFGRDRALRESLILRDVGVWAHYVGDGAQPLHVTMRHNGWGEGPNPGGYTQGRIHSRIDGSFVRNFVPAETVRSRMTSYTPGDRDVRARTLAYLAASRAEVEPLYRLEKAGGFADGDPRGRAFLAGRLAAGVAMTRDLIADAWAASASAKVGYPAVSVADVEAGRADPFPAFYGKD